MEHYPGATSIRKSAFEITPTAGTPTEQSHYHVQNALLDFIHRTGTTIDCLTQTVVATAAGLSQGRISQIAAQFGGWKLYKQLLVLLYKSLYRPTNISVDEAPPLDEEQLFVANTYLPLLGSEEPFDSLPTLLQVAQTYGVKAFGQILSRTSSTTMAQLFILLVLGLGPKPGSHPPDSVTKPCMRC